MVSSEFANLPRGVLVVIGKPYMITSNIYVVDGLLNGAVGVLRVCEFEQGGEEEEGGGGGGERRARRLWLEFDVPGTGKLTRARANRAVHEAKSDGYVIESVTWVPIEMQSVTLTIDREAGISCNTSPRCRIRHVPAIPRHVPAIPRHVAAYLATLKEQELSGVCEGGSREFTLALLNVRSLSAHALDAARDPVLGKVDLLCLTEIWNNGTAAGSGCEGAVVRGYDAAACARAVATRRAGGVDVFLKRYLPFSEELRQQRQSSLLVLDRHICPSVSGGLCGDGADDSVNEYYFGSKRQERRILRRSSRC